MCINLPWLIPEIVEAIRDNTTIDDSELNSLINAIHKSTLVPKSMVSAGFSYYNSHRHSFFIADSLNVDTSKIQISGMCKEPEDQQFECSTNKLIYTLELIKSMQLFPAFNSIS